MKFYVSYSIAGTNTFITASYESDKYTIAADRVVTKVDVCGLMFTQARSRRPDYNEKTDGIKLHHRRLLNVEGKPLRSPPLIVKFFNELAELGWKVDKQAFVDKHWKR